MRILASNPDSVRDLVLRQPMYQRLLDAGFELVALVREAVLPAMQTLVPRATCIPIPSDPYELQLHRNFEDFEGVIQAAKDAAPDLFLVASYQWTQLEEELAESLDKVPVPVMAMNGHVFRGEPEWGAPAESVLRPDRSVKVQENASELEKNRLLCSAVLGQDVALGDPVMQARPEQEAAARQLLEKHAFEPGEFTVAVVGDRRSATRSWPADAWGSVLAAWAKEHGRRFLFLGTEAERDNTLRVCEAMGEQAMATLILMGDGVPLNTVIGLLSLGHSFVGRDTGPLHLATALGRPAIAIYGGGHWPRFLPAGNAQVLTTELPCFECDWKCPFAVAHCIHEVPVEEVTAAIQLLEDGKLSPAVRSLPPAADLFGRMIQTVQKRFEESTRQVGELQREHDRLQKLLYREQETNQVAAEEQTSSRRKLADLQAQLRQSQQQLERSQQLLAAAQEQIENRSAGMQKRLGSKIAGFLRGKRGSEGAPRG